MKSCLAVFFVLLLPCQQANAGLISIGHVYQFVTAEVHGDGLYDQDSLENSALPISTDLQAHADGPIAPDGSATASSTQSVAINEFSSTVIDLSALMSTSGFVEGPVEGFTLGTSIFGLSFTIDTPFHYLISGGGEVDGDGIFSISLSSKATGTVFEVAGRGADEAEGLLSPGTWDVSARLENGGAVPHSGNVSFSFKIDAPAQVPEPSSVALLLLGGFGLVGYGWRKRRQV